MIRGLRAFAILTVVITAAVSLAMGTAFADDLAMVRTTQAGDQVEQAAGDQHLAQAQHDEEAVEHHGETHEPLPAEPVKGHGVEGMHVTDEHDDGHGVTHTEAGMHGVAGHGHGDAHSMEHSEEEAGADVMSILAHHLTDAGVYDTPFGPVHLPVIKGDFSFLGEQYADGFPLTKHMMGLIIAALLVVLLIIPGMASTRKGEVPHGFGNFLEVLVVFIRDEVVYPNMGAKAGRAWLPFFLTAFFLILFCNLLGMIPYGTTATGNINMTAGLAIMMLLAVIFAGFKYHGVKYIASFVPHGVPVFVVPLLFPIEIFGLFVKHFALCIRLFANMLAGHTVIGVFLALIMTPWIAFASVPGAVAISMLELFVAFLQAYIFVMLASIFVGMSVHGH